MKNISKSREDRRLFNNNKNKVNAPIKKKIKQNITRESTKNNMKNNIKNNTMNNQNKDQYKSTTQITNKIRYNTWHAKDVFLNSINLNCLKVYVKIATTRKITRTVNFAVKKFLNIKSKMDIVIDAKECKQNS